MLGLGRRARWPLRYQRTFRRDLMRQIAMGGRVHAVQPGTANRHRKPARGEGASMRLSIDAEGQAAGDGESACGKGIGEGLCILRALRGRVATADDGELRQSQHIRVAQNE